MRTFDDPMVAQRSSQDLSAVSCHVITKTHIVTWAVQKKRVSPSGLLFDFFYVRNPIVTLINVSSTRSEVSTRTKQIFFVLEWNALRNSII